MQTIDASTGEPVKRSELVMGYEYEKGQYVTLTDEDLERVQVESSRMLDLTTFVDRGTVNELHLESPYYVYPQGKPGMEAYLVIPQALGEAKRAAPGRVVLSSGRPSLSSPQEDEPWGSIGKRLSESMPRS